MENPFRYGGVVGAEAFCNRDEEQRDLRRCAENAGRLFLYAGEVLYGKPVSVGKLHGTDGIQQLRRRSRQVNER